MSFSESAVEETGDESDSFRGVRMKEARSKVPRKEGESRKSWKNRVFNYKRAEEERHPGFKGGGKGNKSK